MISQSNNKDLVYNLIIDEKDIKCLKLEIKIQEKTKDREEKINIYMKQKKLYIFGNNIPNLYNF